MVIVEYWGYFQKIAYSNGDYSVAIFSDAITGKSFKVCGIGIPVAKKIKYHFFGEMQVYKKTGEVMDHSGSLYVGTLVNRLPKSGKEVFQ